MKIISVANKNVDINKCNVNSPKFNFKIMLTTSHKLTSHKLTSHSICLPPSLIIIIKDNYFHGIGTNLNFLGRPKKELFQKPLKINIKHSFYKTRKISSKKISRTGY